MTEFESDARTRHWTDVYDRKAPSEVSWYQSSPKVSLELIAASGVKPSAPVIDVGGGASTLVDHLLDLGYSDVTVLDIAASALEASKARLDDRAREVAWVVADATRWRPSKTYALWHDRAVFHFLTDPADRRAYVSTLEAGVTAGGQLVIATFAPDGPEMCSGLPVVRYDARSLGAELGSNFEFCEERREEHTTPAGRTQAFLYQRYRRRAA